MSCDGEGDGGGREPKFIELVNPSQIQRVNVYWKYKKCI